LRVLIAGVDGMIGGNLAYWYSRRASVIGLCSHHPVMLPDCQVVHWKDHEPSDLACLIRETRPHRIIHCGPLARGSWDLTHEPNESPPVDGRRERAICRALFDGAKRSDAQLTVLLSDAVFDGPCVFHDEKTPPVSRDAVSRASATIQRALEDSGALVVRTHAFGWSPSAHASTFAERVWLAITEGLPCVFDPHSFSTPIFAADLAKLLWQAQQRGLSGVYHIAGAERTSALGFASELASLAGMTLPRQATKRDSCTTPRGRQARETSLNSGRIRRELACALPMLREGLAGLLTQLRDGTRARLQGRAQCGIQTEAA